MISKPNKRTDSFLLRLMLLALIIMIGIMPAYSQTKRLSGTVTTATGDALPGVTVLVQGTTNGTITDLDGRFQIDAPDNGTLVFSFMGYESQTHPINGRTTFNVSMSEETVGIDEIVVVGYGTMKRSDITGSVVSVGAEDLKKTVVTSADQALQGRAAGVQVTANSGSPGGGISVSIRGVNSLNGNEPLYVIDGVAIDGQTNGNSSALSTINPSDIVSMEVLKDASATAIYGSRASNGVVLITTKKGQAGKPTISYEGYYAIQQIPTKLETMNLREYAELYNERVDVLGWGEREEFADPSVLGEGTDWQSEIFRNAAMQSHQLSVSGGSDNTQYLISGGYYTQDGSP